MVSKAKRIEQGLARKDIDRLFALAADVARTDQRRADRYVEIARKAAARNRVSLRSYNRVHCRKCSAYFTSRTLRVRTRPSSVVYSCLRCGNIKRMRKDGRTGQARER